MIENYQFKGYSFLELIECFELEQENFSYLTKDDEIEEALFKALTTPFNEEIEKVIYVNGNRVTFTLTDQEEVELEKLRQFLSKNRDDSKVVSMVRLFLIILAEQSEKIDYNYPAFNGILEIEHPDDFITWVIHNLELMWI